MGVLHRAVQIQSNLFERINNSDTFSGPIFAARHKFLLEISSCMNAIKEYVVKTLSN